MMRVTRITSFIDGKLNKDDIRVSYGKGAVVYKEVFFSLEEAKELLKLLAEKLKDA